MKDNKIWDTVLNIVSDNESEHENEEEEWEAQQIRKGVTGAQVKMQSINRLIDINKIKNIYKAKFKIIYIKQF